MNRIIAFLILIAVFAYQTHAQKVGLVNKEWIDAMSQNTSDTTYIINFWATWCKPCVEELPAFESLQKKHKNQKVKVVLVSCDFKKQLDSRVVPFIKTNGLKSEVVLMNEADPNNWIDRVDSRFSGAIPATLIVNGSMQFRFFKEGEITLNELDSIVSPLIK